LPGIVQDACSQSELVIIDAPALVNSPEALGTVVLADAVILVVDRRHPDPAEVRKWVRQLRRRKVEVMGVVFNRERHWGGSAGPLPDSVTTSPADSDRPIVSREAPEPLTVRPYRV
jgi:Mrp family chromosome partitioning ATPase